LFLKIKIVLDGTKLVVGEERGIGFIYGGNITIPNTMTCTWWLGIGVVERHARWWNEIMKAIMGGFGELLYMYLQHIHCAPSPPEESVEHQNVASVQYLACFSMACTLTVRSATLWFRGSSEFDSTSNGAQ